MWYTNCMDISLKHTDGYCDTCGETTTNPKFCSISCSTKMQRACLPWRINYCEYCGNVFDARKDSRQRFCSRSCSKQRLDNERRGGNWKHGNSAHYAPCLNCGEPRGGRKKTYCSAACGSAYRSKKLVDEYLAGKNTGHSNNGMTKPWLRRWLKEQANNACEGCGVDEWRNAWYDGPVPLQVDHIDGDSTNTDRPNLRVLCPTCHATTDTYGAKNVGNGRAYRRNRYRQGKEV